MTRTSQQCISPDKLMAFLRNQVSQEEEADLQLHLEECDACRQRLDESAAQRSDWEEAGTFLGQTESGEASDEIIEDGQGSSSGGWLIHQVLETLGPTDDPHSLGRLGGYEVTGVVGAGGMGVVLKAHERALDRVVAVKVMAPHLASSGSARRRFAREAKAAAAVIHPNVIAIHAVSNEGHLPYLVMPFIGGSSLQRRLDHEGPMSTIDILRVGSQIAAGLAAAHQQGLVHRDIKPANILLDQGVERVSITDFGLARAVDDASMTRTGVIAGTPQFMSPEQARGAAIDHRSDLFSLGSVLYAMCTGRPPFRAETSYGVLRRITDDSPTSISEINAEIPSWLSAVIAKLMQKSPENRFESAAEVSKLLSECLAHVQQPTAISLPTTVTLLSSKRTARPPIGSFIGRWIVGSAFAAVLLLLGVLVVLETNKGTITIECEGGDVPIRILQGDKVVDKLTVTQAGKQVRIAAGTYLIEMEGETKELVVQNNQVIIHRGDQAVVKIARVLPMADEPPAENIAESLAESLAEVVATPELEAQARKALQACQANLSWIEQFQMESVTKYHRTGLGRVEDHQIIAVDGAQMIVKSKSDWIDQAGDFPMKVLESFALDDGKRSMQGTFQADKKMRTGLVTMRDRLEDRWKLFERYGLQLEGFCSGNQGKTVMEILLEAKQLFVSTENVGKYECLRISSRDDWGTTTAWIDVDGKHLLRQLKSNKERGNRFANSKVGDHRDTTGFESFSTMVTQIEYEKNGDLFLAIRGTLVTSQTKNGGTPYTSKAMIERTKIELNPDNFTESLFAPPFAEGARITDYDNFDRDNHFRWRGGQLVPAKNDASGKVTEFPEELTKEPSK